MSLYIVKPGLLDTIQDMGRYGYGSFGINPGGAMDRYAAQVANALVGNEFNEGVIECHFPAAQILFEKDVLISITGAHFHPMLNDEILPIWKPILVRKNTVLHFKKISSGARCYIAINGGFEMDRWLNSCSTNIIAGAGGWFGRKLKAGDRVSYKNNFDHFTIKEGQIFLSFPWQANIKNVYGSKTLYYIKGNEWDLLELSSKQLFSNRHFKIDPSSDKMGYNLKSETLQMKQKIEMISSPVSFGTIQLLPNGQLIILMAD
ncbi:MAG TPA: biotin-dependent carboxyltransferase family protein, partial [Ferruginibacter sp.]|nr:biotin-dependent carboxyltransferase family protein [Ferruginibacter sp.]